METGRGNNYHNKVIIMLHNNKKKNIQISLKSFQLLSQYTWEKKTILVYSGEKGWFC